MEDEMRMSKIQELLVEDIELMNIVDSVKVIESPDEMTHIVEIKLDKTSLDFVLRG